MFARICFENLGHNSVRIDTANSCRLFHKINGPTGKHKMTNSIHWVASYLSVSPIQAFELLRTDRRVSRKVHSDTLHVDVHLRRRDCQKDRTCQTDVISSTWGLHFGTERT